MKAILFVGITILTLSASARAGRDLVPVMVDREFNYDPKIFSGAEHMNEQLAGLKAPSRDALDRLRRMNNGIEELKSQKTEMYYAYDKTKKKLIPISDLTQEEFMEWQSRLGKGIIYDPSKNEVMRASEMNKEDYAAWKKRMDKNSVPKGLSEDKFAQAVSRLEKRQGDLEEKIVNAEAGKAKVFGPKADERAWDLFSKGRKAFQWNWSEYYNEKAFIADGKAVRVAEEKFLGTKLGAKTLARGKAGLVGAAVVGATMGYEMMTGEGAEASELKAGDMPGEQNAEVNERSDVSISELDAQ